MNSVTATPPREAYASYAVPLSANPRLTSTPSSSADHVRPESVDLLQMVPEANNRSRAKDFSLSRSLGRESSPRLLMDDEDDHDEDDGLSMCPHCKEEGIYYSRT